MTLLIQQLFIKGETYRRVAMEDVIVAFTRRTRPNVSEGVTELLHVVQVPQKDLVVDRCAKVSRFEEVNRVQIGNINASRVRRRRIRTVFLDVHAKEAHIHTINLLKGEHGPSSIREVILHLARVHKSKPRENIHLRNRLESDSR